MLIGQFFLNEISEPIDPNFGNVVFSLNIWGYVHWVFPGLLTLIVDILYHERDYIDDESVPVYHYINLFRRMFFYSFLYEVFEYVVYYLNFLVCGYSNCDIFIQKNWFYESVNKKMLDMLQDSISIWFAIICLWIFKAKGWKSADGQRARSYFIFVVLFAVNLLPMLFYKRNMTWNPYTASFQEFIDHRGPNSIAYGYWIHILVWQFATYLFKNEAISINPHKEATLNKVFCLYGIGIFLQSLVNVLWVWSIYILTWIVSYLAFNVLWYGWDHIKEGFDTRFGEDEELEYNDDE